MRCPIYGGDLGISDRSGVEIDYCTSCRDVWLDREKLDKIIDRAAVANPPFPPQTDRGYEKKRKSKSSFLGELFDF